MTDAKNMDKSVVVNFEKRLRGGGGGGIHRCLNDLPCEKKPLCSRC